VTKHAQLPDGTVLEFPEDTPDEVMDKAVREHLQQYGPGPGRPAAPNPQKEQEAFVRANEGPGDAQNLFAGGVAGGYDTALGISQGLAHINPQQRLIDYGFNLAGIPGMRETVDQRRQQFEQEKAAYPGSQSGAFRTGEFGGGMLATSPLAALSIPAKGAGFLSAVGRGAGLGGITAATQSVNGDNFAAEKAKQFVGGSALGAGIPAIGRGAIWTAERIYGPNVMAQIANLANAGANKKPYAMEGEQLAKDTGVRFTPGQVSGSKMQTGLENMSRQSLFSADRAFQADKRTAEDAVRYVERLMDNITKNPASEAAVGAQVQSVTRAAVTKIADQREKIAAQQYGAIDQALGNRAFVQPNNAMAEADAIIKQYSGVVTPEAARIVKQAQELKAKLSGRTFTFTEAQANRGYYGKGARGSTNVFDDIAPDLNRTIATRLFKAFDKDIEHSAARLENGNLGPGIVPQGYFKGQMGPGGGKLAQAVRDANANYKQYSQLIEATEMHPISRLFGDNIKIGDVVQFDKIAPEVVLNRLGQMHPSELHMVRNFMERNAPEAWQQYKRLIVERSLESAQTLPTSAGANTVPFNAALFMRAMGGDKPDKVKKLQAIFSADEFTEIDKAFQVARRLGDRFGYNGSNTGPWMEVQSLLDSIKKRSMQAVASSGGEIFGLRKIANVMLNADGRRALVQLSQAPPKSRQAASAVAFLASLIAGQNSPQPYPNKGTAHP